LSFRGMLTLGVAPAVGAVQAAVGDLGDHMRGRVQDILIGGAARAGLGVRGERG
jgi:hypothetical protein